jgi:hypothetical protein
MSMTLVPENALDNDPRTLPYYFKSMPVRRYSKISSQYYYWRLVKVMEQAAQMYGRVLVPAICFPWRRRAAFKDYQLIVFGKAFYNLDFDKLTDKEKEKYLEQLQQQEYTNSPSEDPFLYTESARIPDVLYTEIATGPEVLYTDHSSGSR